MEYLDTRKGRLRIVGGRFLNVVCKLLHVLDLVPLTMMTLGEKIMNCVVFSYEPLKFLLTLKLSHTLCREMIVLESVFPHVPSYDVFP